MALRVLRIILGLCFLIPYFVLVLWAWGDVSDFVSHPVRTALGPLLLILAVAVALAAAPPREGAREDRGNRWVILPMIVLGFLIAWLPPFAERRGWGVLDGDALRWTGLALFTAGAVLRVVPMYVLGRRFTALVEIQRDHRLVTSGPYRFIRHPSYLGGLVMLAGWCLCFRSLPGLLLLLPLMAVMVGRMDAEERMLAGEFADEYEEYQRRTWRLVPFVY